MGKGIFNEYLKGNGWKWSITKILILLVLGLASQLLSAGPSGTINPEDRIDVYLIPGMGTDYRVLPARRIENAVWIEGGTHKMVINHPETLCKIIDHYLLRIKSDNPSQQDQDG